jgi:hypothetical protein
MSTNIIILHPEFTPSFERFAHTIRIEALDDARDQVEQLFAVASERLKPAAILRVAYIDGDGFSTEGELTAVHIEGLDFRGKALSVLKDIHRVIPYVATCGTEMESFDLSGFDFLAPYWLDAIKLQALGSARKALFDYCRTKYGMGRPMSLNPGSGNVDIWPIQEQQKLFSLLGETDTIGVRLTESSLMIPNKSISGLIFTSPAVDYESCAYCERLDCPDRRVPYRQTL